MSNGHGFGQCLEKCVIKFKDRPFKAQLAIYSKIQLMLTSQELQY